MQVPNERCIWKPSFPFLTALEDLTAHLNVTTGKHCASKWACLQSMGPPLYMLTSNLSGGHITWTWNQKLLSVDANLDSAKRRNLECNTPPAPQYPKSTVINQHHSCNADDLVETAFASLHWVNQILAVTQLRDYIHQDCTFAQQTNSS